MGNTQQLFIDPKKILPQLSTKLYRGMYNYLVKYHSESIFDEVCLEMNIQKAYLLEDDNWVSVAFDEEFSRRIRTKTGDPNIFEKLGMFFLAPENINPVEYQLLKAASPYIVFKKYGHYLAKVNRACTAEVVHKGLGEFQIRISITDPECFYDDMILNIRGVFKAMCEIYGLTGYSVRSSVANDRKSVIYYIEYSAVGYYSRYLLSGSITFFASALVSFLAFKAGPLFFISVSTLFAMGMVGAIYLIYKSNKMKETVEYHSSFYYRTSHEKNKHMRIAAELMDKKAIQEKLLAHDIRSPLSVLNLLIPALQDLRNDERSHLALQAIDRVNNIAEDLLKTQKKPLSFNDRKSVNQIVAEIVREKEVFCESLPYKIEISVKSNNTEAVLELDDSIFSRVMSNLLNNSIESIVDGNGKISITVITELNVVSITISDNGKGIPAEVFPAIGQKGISFGKAGNGLGLFHAIGIVESCRGVLDISSKLGRGTTVSIRLPLKP